MQLTLADKAPDTDLLVLERWSMAPAAEGFRVDAEGRAPDALDELAAQLVLRLDETQIPLWEDRKR